jgi:hypothetical protein
MVELSKTLQHMAQKVAYLVQAYPEHTMAKITTLIQAPAIVINCAIWAAQDLGYISEPDAKTGIPKLLKLPDEWDMGEGLTELKGMLVLAFTHLATRETDLEEHYMSQWTQGFTAHDVLIAMKQLEDEKVLAQYLLEDGKETYTFFTLYENRDKLWGRKQFKKDPLATRKNRKDDKPTNAPQEDAQDEPTPEK